MTRRPVAALSNRLKGKRWLVWLFALTLISHLPVLLLVGLNPSRAFVSADSWQYHILAVNLLDRGTFSLQTVAPFDPDAFRTPGYPLLLVLVYGAFGKSNTLALAAVQVLLASVTTVLTASLCYRLSQSQRVATVAGMIWALSPIPALFSGAVAPEALFTTLIVFVSCSLVRTNIPLHWSDGVLGGGAYGLAILTRPIGILLAPIFALLILLLGSIRHTLRILVILALATLCVLSPWLVRNYYLFGRATLSTVDGFNLLFYNTASFLAHKSGVPFIQGQDMVKSYWQEYVGRHLVEANPTEQSLAMSAAAREIIMKEPLAFAWFNCLDSLYGFAPGVSNAVIFLFPGYLEQESTGDAISPASTMLDRPLVALITAILSVFYGSLYLLSAAGVVFLTMKKQWFVLATLLLPVAVLLYAPGIAANSRFRIPVEPYLAILAAEGVVSLAILLRDRRFWNRKIPV